MSKTSRSMDQMDFDIHAFIRSIENKLEAEPNVYEGLLVENLSLERNQPFQTIRLRSNKGRIIAGSKARVLVLHGHGASYSHIGAVKNIVSDLNLRKGTKQRLFRYLTDPTRSGFKKYVPVSAEAINLPGTLGAPQISNANSLKKIYQWLEPYIIQMAEEEPSLPIFIFGRSGSGMLAEALQDFINRDHGKIIFGSILSSPMYPGDKTLLAVNRALADKLEQERGAENIPEIMDWCFGFHTERNWDDVDFSHRKVLIIAGDEDQEVLPEEKRRFEMLAEKFPQNVFYILSKRRGHDQFKRVGTNNDGPRRQAYKDLYRFIYDALKDSEGQESNTPL